VGRRLTESLLDRQPKLAKDIELDPDLTEMAGLAHDLGHPPFGHTAERTLDGLLANYGGFEGNAQTFRILTKVGFKRPTNTESLIERLKSKDVASTRPRMQGLDLTRGGLASILKYPLLPGTTANGLLSVTDRTVATKPGVYGTEHALFAFARAGCLPGVLAPTAILMDWADDISYAVHDIEDHVRARLIPIHDLDKYTTEILRTAKRRLDKREVAYSQTDLERVFEKQVAFDRPLLKRYDETLEDENRIQKWVSDRIGEFESAVSLIGDPPYVRIEPDAIYKIELLKAVTWYFVLEGTPLTAAQEGQARLVTSLYQHLLDWITNRPPHTVPNRLRELREGIQSDESLDDDASRARAVADYICSLTEPQAIDLFQRVSGVSPAPIFGVWIS